MNFAYIHQESGADHWMGHVTSGPFHKYGQKSVGWNYLSTPKLQRLHPWNLGMKKQFHPIFYNECNYSSMLWLKLNHVSKRDYWWPLQGYYLGTLSNGEISTSHFKIGHLEMKSMWTWLLTHWPLGDLKIFFKMSFSNSYPESIPWAIPAKLLSEVCHRTPLMISQHWFR